MRGFDYEVLRAVDQNLFLLRECAPKQEDDTFLLLVDHTDNFVCEALPTTIAMRAGIAGSYRQYCVQEQDTLSRPLL